MKRIISFFLCIIVVVISLAVDVSAKEIDTTSPVTNITITTDVSAINEETLSRATGLINMYGLEISKSGTTLKIVGATYCISDVVRCGFKNLTVERRLNSSSSWEDYYEYGNKYVDSAAASLSTSLTVESGYQYRVTTKHYAKKSLLVTQTISNESNIIQF